MKIRKSGQGLAVPVTLVTIGLLFLVSCTTTPQASVIAVDITDPSAAAMEEGEDFTDSYEFDAARASYKKALAGYAALDNREGSIQALLALGWNSLQDGDPSVAREYYHHAEALARGGSDSTAVQDVANHRADLALRLGDPVAAAELLEPYRNAGTSGRVGSATVRLLATAEDSTGETETALVLLEKAWNIARSGNAVNEQAQAAYRAAVIYSRQARFEEARDWALKALDADKTSGYRPGIAADLQALAIISEKAGDIEAAEDYYRRAWLAWTGVGRFSDAESARRALEAITGRTVRLP